MSWILNVNINECVQNNVPDTIMEKSNWLEHDTPNCTYSHKYLFYF